MTPIEETTAQRHPAILLLGPTGTGKTPLGNVLALRGWRGQPCLQFDFGANLRELAARNQPDEHISRADLEYCLVDCPRGHRDNRLTSGPSS